MGDRRNGIFVRNAAGEKWKEIGGTIVELTTEYSDFVTVRGELVEP
jgi:hypothetical protein